MFARPILFGLLLAACLPATARDARAPDVDPRPCPTVTPGTPDAGDPALVGERRAPAGSASKTRPGAGAGDAETGVRGPRWHSFLPGMFR